MFRFSAFSVTSSRLAEPASHITDLDIRPVPNANLKSGEPNIATKVTGEPATMALTVKDHDGRVLTSQTQTGSGSVTFDTMLFDHRNLWSPQTPYLYQLTIEAYDADHQLLEVVPYQFGFRTVELRDDKVIYVNNKRLVINGVNRQMNGTPTPVALSVWLICALISKPC